MEQKLAPQEGQPGPRQLRRPAPPVWPALGGALHVEKRKNMQERIVPPLARQAMLPLEGRFLMRLADAFTGPQARREGSAPTVRSLGSRLRLVGVVALTLLGLAACIGTPAASTTTMEESNLTLSPRWSPGQTYVIEIEKGRERRVGDRVTLRGRSTTQVEVAVLEETPDGYTVEWRFGQTRLDDPAQAAEPLVRELFALADGMRVRIAIDGDGSYAGLTNYAEVRTRVDAMIATMFRVLAEQGMSEQILSGARDAVDAALGTKEKFEDFALKELNIYYMLFGVSFADGATIDYDDLLPNAFGGDPFPSRGHLLLKERDRRSGLATIEWTQALEPVETRRILLDTMTGLAERMGRPAPRASDLPELAIDDQATFVFNERTGRPPSLRWQRTARSGNTAQVDSIVIREP